MTSSYFSVALAKLCRAAISVMLSASLVSIGAAAHAQQSSDPLSTSPRGVTQIPKLQPLRDQQRLLESGDRVRSGKSGTAEPIGGMDPMSHLPPDPATSLKPLMFGSQMFSGRFAAEAFSGFNPEYQIAVGDRVNVRMWGAFSFEATQVVDVQGNLFIPNVGPVQVLGVRNADLNRIVEAQIKRTYRASVGIYATLEAAQPVKIYVTGFVRAPGLYGGLSSDSVLAYLDRAGGIDPDRGSYLEVDVLRGGKPRAKVNLYEFLLNGRIETLQLQDGDTLVVAPRKFTVAVSGEVLNPYIFEFGHAAVTGTELLAVARPRPGATHLSVVRKVGADQRSEYHSLQEAASVSIQDGDEVTVTSDKYPGTILVRVEGAHLGERTLVLPYGSHLRDALARIKPAPQSRMESVQLYRRSVALRQKELIEASLRSLETYALTARSATSEEAALRSRESQQILEFIDRARQVQPRGQVVLAQGTDTGNTLMEDGDILNIPAQSNLILVNGEVMFPSALVFDARAKTDDYVSRSGGYTQGADKSKLLVVRQDGSVAEGNRVALVPGDEIMVLPKIETKSVELTRGITQIIYQIAIAAKVLFDL
ncbi:polysaccharide biosynthesis/export family protein [Methylibium petroleiphilum]|uniref:polysaccharide biosynthesis/export family protein n=1 Tax=Methylibium petroleiphilum TaxID=105560 RepID=UPI001AC6287D|nr:polysaccharide biosynthesis/export family protein [Methylibium petroleiphilum]MBN9204233.1 polysaccharide biosynthesis/export family protein [Methylibium petroleiphilum]